MLFNIIKGIFPSKNIIHHYRPSFLEGLEIDIFIEGLNIGIEYQGIQHFEPINHWGGEEAFRELVKRDKRKKELCKINNVIIVYFDYEERLSTDYVMNKINSIMNNTKKYK